MEGLIPSDLAHGLCFLKKSITGTASAVCMGTVAVRDCIISDSWNPEPTDSEVLYYLITGVRYYSLDWVA